GRPLAWCPRPARRGRGGPARRLLLRRLPAVRCDRPVRAGDGRPGARRQGRAAGARNLQRLPDPVRGAPAAGGADPQRRPEVHHQGRAAAGGERGHRVDPGLLRRRADRRAAEERGGRLCGRCGHAGRPRGSRAGRHQVRRGQPERFGGRHRGGVQRGGHRGRADAASGARGRPAHRPVRRRPRVLRLGAVPGGGVAMTDTLAPAPATAGPPQPFAELGVTADEYEKIVATVGRRPTGAELALYSVMWSEHCSYKSSKVHLRQFAATAPPSGALLAGIGHNAGVVDIGQGYAVTFKIESHNHPSYVEPHQGAATGVGGIVRDILAMGARPVAVMDALRFGPADAPDTGRVLPGVVGGISFYGNCLGLPNIGGELDFDPSYAGNPLVNALCVGVMRHGDLQVAAASGPGSKVILFGSTTGPDGVGGASVLASATFGDASGGTESAKRPSVQVGDPFTEKLLVECCLELFAGGLVTGIQDLGAAGVACATTELAAAGTGGMLVRLDEVPLRDASLG